MTLEPASRAAASQTMAASPVSPQQPRGAGVMRSQNRNQVYYCKAHLCRLNGILGLWVQKSL